MTLKSEALASEGTITRQAGETDAAFKERMERISRVMTGRPPGSRPPQSRVPNRVVPADDLTIEIDGQEYHPHAGETVTMRGVDSIGSAPRAVRLGQLYRLAKLGSGALNPEEETELLEVYRSSLVDIARSIVAWDWTDACTGEALPAPNSEIIEGLSSAEFLWLAKQGW